MKAKEKKRFNELYERHQNLMKLHGVAAKTIEAYARGVRRVMMGVIKQLGEILHRILSNVRHHKTYKKFFTSHFIAPVAPIFLEA